MLTLGVIKIPSWGFHIRLADMLIQKLKNIDKVSFLVGNISPDCGILNSEKKAYLPPKRITHWYDENEIINVDKFINVYLSQKYDLSKQSFYLGYLCHLITDKKYQSLLKEIFKNNYDNLAKIDSFWKKVKNDWINADCIYFKSNNNNIFFNVFYKIEDFPDYLDYYPNDRIKNQIKIIKNFYKDRLSNSISNNYYYISYEYIEKILIEIEELVLNKLKSIPNISMFRN